MAISDRVDPKLLLMAAVVLLLVLLGNIILFCSKTESKNNAPANPLSPSAPPIKVVKNFQTDFDYPLNRNIVPCATALSRGEQPDCEIINRYPYDFLIENENLCAGHPLDKGPLLLVIKSATNNTGQRQAIRHTWGQQRELANVTLKRVFVVGTDLTEASQLRLQEESAQYGDLIVIDFLDTYLNVTIKTILTYKWILDHCPSSKYYLFADDDMYVSVKAVQKFLRRPADYATCRAPSDARFMAGRVISGRPVNRVDKNRRHYINSTNVFPYNLYPPYLVGGFYIMNKAAVESVYYASFFTKHFFFDDNYVGILALKINLDMMHCDKIYLQRKECEEQGYDKSILSCHNYRPKDLIQVWMTQQQQNDR